MKQRSFRGFTLLELVLVVVIIAILLALLFPVLSSARRSSRIAQCTSNLRQIGTAVRMYVDDWGEYPLLGRVLRSAYLSNRHVLVCAEDEEYVPKGAFCSYPYRVTIPPAFAPLEGQRDIDPSVVLFSCEGHLHRPKLVHGDELRLGEPAYPYYLLLRAGGQVTRARFSEVREVPVPADRPTFTLSYPGEPRYDAPGRPLDGQ